MCGRYTLTTTGADLEALLPGLEAAASLSPRFNVAPTQAAAVVLDETPRRISLLRWGLVPAWARDAVIGSRMINARAETLAEKPSFRAALKSRRCLVLADGFYEWRKDAGGKTPLHVRLASRAPFAMAGLWEAWRRGEGDELRTFTIITTAANAFMAGLHDRMPALLPASSREAWLARGKGEAEPLLALLRPWEGEALEAVPVSRRVNDPRNEGPECLLPA